MLSLLKCHQLTKNNVIMEVQRDAMSLSVMGHCQSEQYFLWEEMFCVNYGCNYCQRGRYITFFLLLDFTNAPVFSVIVW